MSMMLKNTNQNAEVIKITYVIEGEDPQTDHEFIFISPNEYTMNERNEATFTEYLGNNKKIVKKFPCETTISLIPSDEKIKACCESPNLILDTPQKCDTFRTMETIDFTKRYVKRIDKAILPSFGIERIIDLINDAMDFLNPNRDHLIFREDLALRIILTYIFRNANELTEVLVKMASDCQFFDITEALQRLLVNNLMKKQLVHYNYFFNFYSFENLDTKLVKIY